MLRAGESQRGGVKRPEMLATPRAEGSVERIAFEHLG